MKIRALINLVVSADKEIPVGKECEVRENDAKDLIKRGFAIAVPNQVNKSPERKENEQSNSNKKSSNEHNEQTGSKGKV